MRADTDVVIIGAGLSGIDGACRLRQECPDLAFEILEARDAMGGTWDLFRYPGVRSDSDMFTYSYPFQPWTEDSVLAPGETIRDYIRQTAQAHGVSEQIRYHSRVTQASWSTHDELWRLTVSGPDGEYVRTARFVYACTGYFRYDEAYQPTFPGRDDFTGRFVHPQFWPADLAYAGQRFVVIGSGATAATLVPALCERGARVTMLQRSPSYYASLPNTDPVAARLRRRLPARLAHRALRTRNAMLGQALYQGCRAFPRLSRKILQDGVARVVGTECQQRHFTPAYRPWDQRLCVLPDADLLEAVRQRRVRIVTDGIDRLVPQGVRLNSGELLEADVIVSATGLQLLALGGIRVEVDGTPVDLGTRLTYRGVMIEGIPNLAYCVGYTNASWTLRADLVARYVCRLLRHLKDCDLATALPLHLGATTTRPLLGLTSGYVQRATRDFPRRGPRSPWTMRQNYVKDWFELRFCDLGSQILFVPRSSALPKRRVQEA